MTTSPQKQVKKVLKLEPCLDYLPIFLWLMVSSPERSLGEEPLCDEEVKLQLSCFMCLPLVILLREKCLSMSPRPDLIPGGTAREIQQSLVAAYLGGHMSLFHLSGGGMSGMPRLPLLHNLSACFPWKK